MKTTPVRVTGCFALTAALLSTASVNAQTTTTESTVRERAATPAAETETATTFTGTVSSWESDVLVINPGEGLQPVRYSWSKSTRYTDENGKAVSRESIRAGAPVTVYYSRDGNRAVADRVVLQRAAAAAAAPAGVPGAPASVTRTTEETTTTTLPEAPPTTVNKGEVYRMEGDTLMVRTKNGEEPINYIRSNATVYVDETNTPVKASQLKTGMPVTIYYTEDRVDQTSVLRADKIMINRSLPAQPATEATAPPASASKADDVLSGSVSTVAPNSLSIRPKPGALPVKYTWRNTPVCVDEEGRPVDIALISTGTPVTVQFSGSGDNMVAERITVKRAELVPPGTTIEQRAESSTTTVRE